MYYLKRFTDANYWLQIIAVITKQKFSSCLRYFWSTYVNLARVRTGNEQFPQKKKFTKKPFRTPSKSVFAIYKHVLKRKLKRTGTEITQETIWKLNQGGEGISFTMAASWLGSVTRKKRPRVAGREGTRAQSSRGSGAASWWQQQSNPQAWSAPVPRSHGSQFQFLFVEISICGYYLFILYGYLYLI